MDPRHPRGKPDAAFAATGQSAREGLGPRAMTERLTPDEAGLDRAAELLRAGALVAFPTETVYGLGADARDDRAVARIFEAKGRPLFNPLIVHLSSLAEAGELVAIDAAARALAERFWPGPLTLVLPLREGAGIAPLVSAGLATLAVRVPGAGIARDLLARVGRPVAAPSANPSGRISPTRAEHVLAGLDGRIEAVLDGGPALVGVESTILAPGPDGTRLLRPGGVSAEDAEAVLGVGLLPPDQGVTPSAPGQLASHYAPRGRVRLNAASPEAGETFLGFGPGPAELSPTGDLLSLSPTGDLVEAAARLFHCLQELDAVGAERIAVAPVPETGLGRAINDRLRRAAAPRA